MNKETKRVIWIDIMKYICIMMVMLSHLETNTEFWGQIYYPFYLNGFFFASGYVYFHKDKFRNFLFKKSKGLLLPWLIFSVANILLSQIISFNEHSSLREELKWNFLQIRGKGDGLWFVAALFVTFLPFYLIVNLYEKSAKGRKERIILIIIGFALSLVSKIYTNYMDSSVLPWNSVNLPWHIEYIFVAMFWMILGYLFRTCYETTFDNKLSTSTKVICGVAYLVGRLVPFFLNVKILGEAELLVDYVFALFGVCSLIYVSKLIKANKYFIYIGQNTLLCFALHGKLYSVMQTVFKRAIGTAYTMILENSIMSTIFALVFTVVLSIILIIPIYIINRWLPFLIGKNNKKK